jgi:DNA-binding transcriptional regulator YiaG
MSTKKDDLDTKSCCGLNEAMSPEQCRAARAWLGWSQQALATRAEVGLSTVKDFENGSRKPIANNRNALQGALEAAGIRFDNDPKGGHPIGIRIDGKPAKG